MRKYCYTFALLLLTLPMTLLAQKLDTKAITVKYKQLPLQPLDKEIKSYSTAIRSGYILFDDKERLERDYLKVLEGYSHDVSGEGDVMIMVTFKGIDIINYEEKHDTKDDKSTFNYRYNVTYTFPAKLEVYRKNGERILDYEMSAMSYERKANFGKNNEFATEAELLDGFKSQKGDFFHNLENQLAKEMLNQAKNELVTNFAFPQRSQKIRIGYGKGKRIDYSDLEKARDLAYRGYSLMNQGRDGLAEFQEAIDIWESALTEANLSDKKARINQKIARWMHYNCAMAYAMLDDYENSMKHVLETEIVKHQGVFAASFNSAELKTFVEDRQRRYEANL